MDMDVAENPAKVGFFVYLVRRNDMRMSFFELFEVTTAGQIQPRTTVRIGGVQMTPGVVFGGGVQFGGVDLHSLQGRDLEVENEGGVHVIKGVY